MTHNTLLVLRALAAEPGREMYGLEIMRAIALASGTVYPLLDRTEAAGWVAARTEDITPQDEGRPRRRYYRITPDGLTAAGQAMERETARLAALGIATAPTATATSARQPQAGPASPVGEPLPAASGDCPHPPARITKGLCNACGTYVGKQ